MSERILWGPTKPPVDHESWNLVGYDLTPTDLQGLGHLLYRVIFSEIRTEHLLIERGSDGKPVIPQDPLARPATLYVLSFAAGLRVNPTLLSDWTDQASMEIATAVLPRMRQYAESIGLRPDTPDPITGWHRNIEIADSISRNGLEESVRDHESFCQRLDMMETLLPLAPTRQSTY